MSNKNELIKESNILRPGFLMGAQYEGDTFFIFNLTNDTSDVTFQYSAN